MRKVANFDIFSSTCPYFTSKYDVNNYYACTHPEQTGFYEDKSGVERGCCYCQSCPLGIAPDESDLDNPDVDWGDITRDDLVDKSGEFIEDSGDYIMINTGEGATRDEVIAWEKYEKYINRYNR